MPPMPRSSGMCQLYEQLFAIQPELIVHDLHPGYASTTYAKQRADREGLELLGVQHHHAHMASLHGRAWFG